MLNKWVYLFNEKNPEYIKIIGQIYEDRLHLNQPAAAALVRAFVFH